MTTASQLLGEARSLLEAGGFHEVGSVDIPPANELRIFEDNRSIVGLVFFPTAGELAHGWRAAQAAMVQRVSETILRNDPKSWDGYLVLLTNDETMPTEAVAEVRNDTSRLRKLVSTGRDLRSVTDVKDALLPILPFDTISSATPSVTATGRLVEMLADQGVEGPLAEAALDAFRKNRSPMAGIWSWRLSQCD